MQKVKQVWKGDGKVLHNIAIKKWWIYKIR